jgi:acetyltransferase-like isoleucine patch superfamily enzyme
MLALEPSTKVPSDGSRSGFVDPGAVLAGDATLGPGAVVGADAVVGAGSVVGAGAVILPGTRVGAGCTIEALAVVGKSPKLRPGSSAASEAPLEALVLSDGVTVCCGAVVYAGARVGIGAIVGDQSQVRERSVVGARTVVGRGSCVDFDSVVGERVSIQTGVYLTAGALVEDDVFLGPGVQTTNDNTMGRHPRGSGLAGPVLRRACRVGSGAILLPGIEVGEEALVAAGALVTRDVGAREVVMGVPARVVRRVSDEELLERWR